MIHNTSIPCGIAVTLLTMFIFTARIGNSRIILPSSIARSFYGDLDFGLSLLTNFTMRLCYYSTLQVEIKLIFSLPALKVNRDYVCILIIRLFSNRATLALDLFFTV